MGNREAERGAKCTVARGGRLARDTTASAAMRCSLFPRPRILLHCSQPSTANVRPQHLLKSIRARYTLLGTYAHRSYSASFELSRNGPAARGVPDLAIWRGRRRCPPS